MNLIWNISMAVNQYVIVVCSEFASLIQNTHCPLLKNCF